MESQYRQNRTKRYTSRRHTHTGRRQEEEKTRRRVVKLAVCAVILALAVIVRLLFPSVFTSIGDRFSSSVDLKSAFAAIGEGLSGEKEFSEALGEAYEYAFRGGADSDVEQVSAEAANEDEGTADK